MLLLACLPLVSCAAPGDPIPINVIGLERAQAKLPIERASHVASDAHHPAVKPRPQPALSGAEALRRPTGERPALALRPDTSPPIKTAIESQGSEEPRSPASAATFAAPPRLDLEGSNATASASLVAPGAALGLAPVSPLPKQDGTDTAIPTLGNTPILARSWQTSHDLKPAPTVPTLCNVGRGNDRNDVAIATQPCPVDLRPTLRPGELF